jgi:hypothetical protein
VTRSNLGSRATATVGGVATAALIWAVLAFLPSSAAAEGGTSIASAPTVTYGQQQFGNTATGAREESCENKYFSFWGLPVLAGDEAIVDWESVAHYTQLYLMPVGTTDFTFHQTIAVAEQGLSTNNKNQLRYRAPVTGTMPLVFFYCEFESPPGPYTFIASIRHAVFATLTPITNVYKRSTITGTASLADGTPAPDGMVFNLVAKWHSGRELLRAATSATTAGGSLAFQLVLPPETAGKAVRLAITRGEDGAYQATRSTPVNVKVARKSRGQKHRHHKRRHKHRHR